MLSGLNAGSYVVYADYSGDGNYAPAQDSIAISVSKVDVAVSVVVLDKVYTADVSGNVFASVDGEYKVIIGNYETQVIVKDGVGSFDVGILNVGNYVAYVCFDGTSEIAYGGAVEIAQGLPGDATGSVTYSFANGTVIRVVGVNESFVLSGLNAGSYVVYADYSGDGNYAPASDSIVISVSKGDIKLIVIVFDVIYPQEVNGVVYSSVDGEFNLTIGNYSTIVDVNNRLCEFNLGVLDVGDYSGTVSYPGDGNYAPVQCSFTFKVDDIPLVVPMASEFGEITIGDDQSVSIVLKDEDGNAIANAQITYVVNGKAGNVTTDGDGKFTIMGENGATITVNYEGNETIAGTNLTLKLNDPVVPVVVKVATRFDIENRAITINGYAVDVNAGEEGIYYATRLLDANGNPLSNVYMEFAVNNKIYNRTTYENGSFKPYKLNMVRAGRYTMALNFAGNDNYTGTFACVCVDLNKKPIKINAPAKSYKAATKTKKYTVTLSTIVGSSHDGKAHLRSGLKVTLKVNGKTYSGKTNSKGKVTFKITNLKKKAKYQAVISYVGDKTYESASKKVKITVK